MEVMEASVRRLAQLMRSIGAERDDGMAVLLILETEEDMQEFFTWFENLDKKPTAQVCFEKAAEIVGLMEEG